MKVVMGVKIKECSIHLLLYENCALHLMPTSCFIIKTGLVDKKAQLESIESQLRAEEQPLIGKRRVYIMMQSKNDY